MQRGSAVVVVGLRRRRRRSGAENKRNDRRIIMGPGYMDRVYGVVNGRNESQKSVSASNRTF